MPTASSLVVAFALQSGKSPGWLDKLVRNFDQALPELSRAIGAIVAVVLGYALSRVFARLFGRAVARRFERPSITRTVLRSVRIVIVLGGIFTGMYILGFRPGDLLISVTVFSAVIGVVLAPLVGSVINGLFVLADQPYEIGDMIEISDSGRKGFVEDITLRYTKVFTMENTFVVIPNSTIRNRDVINYSAEDERTRLTLQVLVTYEGNVEEARRLIEKAAREVEVVITGGPDIRIGSARYPAGPTCYIDEFADHGILLSLRYWAKEPYKLLTVRSAVQTNVWDALEDADVEIAYPHQHHVFDENSGQANVAVQHGSPDEYGESGRTIDGEDREP